MLAVSLLVRAFYRPGMETAAAVTAYVALGSNLGDREALLDFAVEALAATPQVEVTGASRVYETEPVGPGPQGPYLNAIIGIDTTLPAAELLDALLEIEAERGRVRAERWGPRTLDLDLLWFRGERIDTPGLRVPHPEIRNRPFVLAPLADVAPSLGDVEMRNAKRMAFLRFMSPLKISRMLGLAAGFFAKFGSELKKGLSLKLRSAALSSWKMNCKIKGNMIKNCRVSSTNSNANSNVLNRR